MRALTVAALTSQILPDLNPLPVQTWRAISQLADSEIVPYAIRNLPGQDVKTIQRRLERIEEFEAELERLSELGIQFTTVFEASYPALWMDKLGPRAPSHLFLAGNPVLLQESAIGVVGSRELDTVGQTFSREIGTEIAALGRVLVSGAARGVDEIAMRACLEHGGRVVGILADSLAKAIGKWPIDSGRLCLVSPFAPQMGFQVANAMSRNKLIYASSQATVVVSSSLESGGTWAGAVEAIRHQIAPVLVRETRPMMPGNGRLLEMGGRGLAKASDLGSALETCQPSQGSLL